MGSSNVEAKTPIPSTELAHPNLKIQTDPTNNKLNASSSNVSSPDSPLDNPFLDDAKSSSSTSSSPNHKLGKAPFSSIPKPEPCKREAPSVQVMEHPNSSYRIPASVFATSKSKAGDWSVASNESLFSIHTGNMSFTNDYYSFRMKELGGTGEASMSGQRISPPGAGKVGEKTSCELGVAADARTKEVIRKIEDQNYEKSLSHRSDRSNISTQSFAFPILQGGVPNDASIRMGTQATGEPQRQRSKPEVVEHPTRTDSEPKPPSQEANTTGASSMCSCLPCRPFFK